jgi:predicted lipid-binding transport protein (Tim44 family)
MIEIIFWALLSAYLFSRLWAVLGTRSCSGPEKTIITIDATAEPILPPSQELSSVDERFQDVQESLRKQISHFNWEFFIHGSEEAFRYIVTQFHQGHIETIQNLVSPVVFRLFADDIQDRQTRGIWHQITIEKIQAELLHAEIQEKRIIAQVKFMSDQKILSYNQEGRLVGNLNQLTNRFVDVWNFSKELREPSSQWTLIAIRSEP